MGDIKGLYPSRYCTYKDDREALEAEEELLSNLAPNELWSDPDFVPSGEAIYLDPYFPPTAGLPPIGFDWLRINQQEIVGMDEPRLFSYSQKGDTAGGLVQGALANKSLINAFAVLATRPERLAELFVSSKHKDRGLYTVKVYKGGKATYVHVDDRIPCTKAGKPYFASSRDPNEAWPLVLEKAIAKLHGCYEAMQHGLTEEGLRDLTFGAVVTIEMCSNQVPTDVNTERNLLERVEKLLSVGAAIGVSLEAPVKLLDASPNSISMSSTSNISASNNDKAFTDRSARTGILPLHAYGIVGVKRFYAEPTETLDGEHVMLVKLSKSWAEGVWKGRWNASDVIWDSYPKLKAELMPKPKPTEPPSFYMTYQDFLQQFNTVYVSLAPTDPAFRFTTTGRWIPGDPRSDAGGCPMYDTFSRNPQYCFQLTDLVNTLLITLSQADHRWQHSQPPIKKYETPVGFLVMKLSGGKRRHGRYHTRKMMGQAPYFSNTRDISATLTLPPGRYAVIPCSYAPSAEMERFVLDVVSDTSLEPEQLNGEPADMDDKESDDELEEEKVTDSLFPRRMRERPFEDASDRVYASLQMQVADLSNYIFGLRSHIEALEGSILGSSSSESSVKS